MDELYLHKIRHSRQNQLRQIAISANIVLHNYISRKRCELLQITFVIYYL